MKFKFYIVPEGNKPCYQHDAVSLAEGLKKMGFKIYGNGNYWYNINDNDYLIKKEPTGYKADINIYNDEYLKQIDPKWETVDLKNFNVLLDFCDGFNTISKSENTKKFNIILRTHYNTNLSYKENVIPWAFGIVDRIKEENLFWENVNIENRVFENYRVFYNGRFMAKKRMNQIIKKRFPIISYITDEIKNIASKKNREKALNSYWWQTYFRHDPKYYEILNSSLLTYCFGGPIIPNVINSKYHHILDENILKYLRKISIIGENFRIREVKYYINYQYDSWRFWEAMSSNSCPIHMNFEEWGFKLPQNPQEGVHYIGVSGLNFEDTAKKIINMDVELIKKIAASGKQWSIENYSSLATAERFKILINKY